MRRANWASSTSVALPQVAQQLRHYVVAAGRVSCSTSKATALPTLRRTSHLLRLAALASERSLDVVSRLKKAQKALDKLKTSMESNLFRQAI